MKYEQADIRDRWIFDICFLVSHKSMKTTDNMAITGVVKNRRERVNGQGNSEASVCGNQEYQEYSLWAA